MLKGFILKITTAMLTLILPLLPSSIWEGLESLTMKREWREIADITSPQQVIWRDDNRILFVLEDKLLEYSLDDDTLIEIGKREPNQFIGIGRDDEIIFCKIEHYIISSSDEFSTKFTVELPNEENKELYFFETIQPLDINGQRIIAVTALDFLEKNFYIIDIENRKSRQIAPLKKVKRTVFVPKDIQFKKAYVRNKERYVVEDLFGNVYLFIKETNPLEHIQKSTPNSLRGK
jgi:hypothetical protein